MTVLRKLGLLVCLACSAILQSSLAAEQEFNGRPGRSAHAQPTGRLIVKWREPAKQSRDAKTRAQKATAIAGLELEAVAASPGTFEVVQIAGSPAASAINEAVHALERNAEIEYASIEYRRKAHAVTSDPLLIEQWYLLSGQPAATRTEAAWDVTQSNSTIIVAVLDTGVLFAHPDLGSVATGGKLLPGYDFVSNATVANDGNGRDPDPSDPGDWVTVADSQQAPFDQDCLTENGDPIDSSWHGTRVAGLVAARTNNAAGIAGNAYDTVVLPLRVLGKCGGVDTDIIDAMRWAAGLPVGALPLNPTPAKVINLSLGGEGACTSAYQSAVNDVIAAGALVVASAGNEGGPVSAPANCPGVLGVAGLRHIGTKVGFSNLGPEVGIGAPGGNCVNTNGGPCLYSIVVTTNTGTTTPSMHTYTDQFNYNIGTSFSSPMVASAAALMRAVNSTLTPAQTAFLLKDTAMPYPTNSAVDACTVPTANSAPQNSECNCTADTCGAGMLDTGAAVAAAVAAAPVQQTQAVVHWSGTLEVGSSVSLDGTASFAGTGRSLASSQWSVVNLTGTAPVIANATSARTTMALPGSAQFTLRLTVTDDQGAQDSEDVAIATVTPQPAPTPTPTPTPDPAPPPAPAPIASKGGGGGGGAFGLQMLALISLAGVARRYAGRKHSVRGPMVLR